MGQLKKKLRLGEVRGERGVPQVQKHVWRRWQSIEHAGQHWPVPGWQVGGGCG